ncbi:LacI family DNA-binding transcriptional regulator [Qipengyuania sp. DSG2-2]|uniref:LacI family DNA-binding transcriptional regulator n=1 Tax=Qipengyuania sp. DGS2-2 TaxID=3349631 RepID=UPI0036D3B482
MARRRQSVTIKHVAADAGVSLQTVSRVINNEPNVRPKMQERVQASIDKLGYVPSIAAQRMSGSKSYLILALNDRERTVESWRAREGNDWVDQMLLGGMLTCAEHGYRMIIELVDTHNDHVEKELQAVLSSLRPDGVMLTPPHSDNPLIVKLFADAGLPFARIGSQSRGPGIAISMDDAGSARKATEHLLAYGHKRIGFIAGPPDYELSGWREDGWRGAMAKAGLGTAGLSQAGDFSEQSGSVAARALLGCAEPPTAIIASNDQMALGALKVAREMSLDVPSDLSLISFDNSPLVKFAQPPLTAIDQPIAETASVAAQAIIEANRGEDSNASSHIVQARLVERQSVALPCPARPAPPAAEGS